MATLYSQFAGMSKPAKALFMEILRSAGIIAPVREIEKIGVGLHNISYRIGFQYDCQDDVVLRVRYFDPPSDRQQFESETIVSGLLRSRINIPRLLYSSSDRQRFGFRFSISEFIPGCTLDTLLADPHTSRERAQTLVYHVANLSAQIHQIHRPTFGTLSVPWPDTMQGFVSKIFTRVVSQLELAAPDLGSLYQEAIPKWLMLFERLPAILNQPTLVHGDLHGRNICVTPDNTFYVLDWESSAFGIGLSDLAQFRYYDLRRDRNLAEYFINAYAEALGLTTDFKLLMSSLAAWECYWQSCLFSLQLRIPSLQGQYYGSRENHLQGIRLHCEQGCYMNGHGQ